MAGPAPERPRPLCLGLTGGVVKGRVQGVEVAAVQAVLDAAKNFSESLEMYDFPFPQKADGVADFRILDDPQDVVVGGSGFLFRRQILEQVGDGIPFGLKFTGVEGNAAGGLGPDAGGVVDIVGAEAGVLDFLGRQVPGQLVDDGGDHFQMGQFFGADVGKGGFGFVVGHGVALGQIAHGRAEFAIGAAVLQ